MNIRTLGILSALLSLQESARTYTFRPAPLRPVLPPFMPSRGRTQRRYDASLGDLIQQADTAEEVDRLLLVGATYQRAADGTIRKWKRMAIARKAELAA